jgi:hypothetical protein
MSLGGVINVKLQTQEERQGNAERFCQKNSTVFMDSD